MKICPYLEWRIFSGVVLLESRGYHGCSGYMVAFRELLFPIYFDSQCGVGGYPHVLSRRDEGGKTSTNNIMYSYCVKLPSDLNLTAHFSVLSIILCFTVHLSILSISLIYWYLRKKSTVRRQASHSTIHSVTMTRRGRGPKRRALDKVTDKVVTEALLGNGRTTKSICDHSYKGVPLPCRNTMVSADIAVTDFMI